MISSPSSVSTSNGVSVRVMYGIAVGRGCGPRGLAAGAAAGAPPRRVGRGRLRLVGVAHGVLLSFVSLARAGSRRRRRRSSPVAPPEPSVRAAARPRTVASTARSCAGCPSHRRNAPGSAARSAVSIFSTRRTTSSISARAARFSSAIRAPVPAALPADVTCSGIAVGHQAQDQRVHRVDVRAERAGQADAVDGLDAQVVHQQPAPGVERRLRQLDLPDVVLRDDQARRRRRAARRRTCGRRGRRAASGPPARRR